MLRITIELVPNGIEAKRRTIAVGEIANDGTGDYVHGNYDAWFVSHRAGKVEPADLRTKVHRHHRNLGPWNLLAVALNKALGEETT